MMAMAPNPNAGTIHPLEAGKASAPICATREDRDDFWNAVARKSAYHEG
jgi:hypothetical protein